jgi:cell division protein ZipA
MGMRELLILLLGLAIVAVILRGLYVALQARRGQIRLAIDKNIPRDVDLDDLELAELPGGGARVIPRGTASQQEQDTEQDDPIEQANERAHSLDLGHDDEAVPVLMESVQVESVVQQTTEDDLVAEESATSHTFNKAEVGEDEESEWDDNDYDEFDDPVSNRGMRDEPTLSDYSDDDEYESDDILNEAAHDHAAESEPGRRNVSDDGLASVQPDYPDEEDDDGIDASGGYERDAEPDYDQYGEDREEVLDHAVQDDWEDTSQGAESEDDLDDFSMTAGERIGGHLQETVRQQRPAEQNLAADQGDSAVPIKRNSLFSALRNRFRSRISSLKDMQQEDAVIDELPSEQDLDLPELTDYVAQESVEVTAAPKPVEPVVRHPTQQLDIESAVESDDSDVDGYEDEIAAEQESLKAAGNTPQRESLVSEHRAHSSQAQKSEVREQDTASQSSEVIVLNVMAHEGREFRGEDLIHTIIASGLKFGDMQIFHHRFGKGSNGPVIFSLANILNPGTFDLNNMAQFNTIGVSLFMAMPTPINNLDAFEQMLAVAQQLCTTLDGELKDDHRNVMTAQTIEHYRQRIRDFELRQLKTAGSRG